MKPNNTPETCVCWDDPNWNCMIPVCDDFGAGADGLCNDCDHAKGCHVSTSFLAATRQWAETSADAKKAVLLTLKNHLSDQSILYAPDEWTTQFKNALETAITLLGDRT